MQMSEMHSQSKFTCGCCSDSPEGTNSDEVIFQYFGKEFTEYEYIVENLAIRPAPKKLLDLVPVHSTNVKFNCNSGNKSSSNDSMMANKQPIQPISGPEGDICRTQVDTLKIKDSKEDFISFKTRPKGSKRFAPCPYPEQPLTQPSRPLAKNYAEFRQRIINKDYRSKTTTNSKQVLSDLCRASEASLNIKARKRMIMNEYKDGSVPKDIQDTIESLRFKKMKPDFQTRNENNLFQLPEVYCLNLKRKKQSSDIIINNIMDSFERKPSHESLSFNIDSMAQTEISNASPCPKKDKKSLKWKIIINKHHK